MSAVGERTLVAGIDVGGTKSSIVVTDESGTVRYEHVAPTDAPALIHQLGGLVRDAQAQLGEEIVAVGVAIPGQVDPEHGSVRMAVNLGITYLPLASLLEADLAIPVFVEHDVRAAVVWLSGQAAGEAPAAPASVVFVAVGTGVSAGIVLDGVLLRGDNRLAGEVGHIVVDPDGVACPCGMRGCLETLVAGPGIARQAQEAVDAGRQTGLTAGATAGDVFRAAAAGDLVAVEIVDRVAGHLARLILALSLTLGIRRAVIGGGVAAAGPTLLDPIRSRLARERAASPLVDAAIEEADVTLLSPSEAPGARGAALIARRRVRLPEREGVGER